MTKKKTAQSSKASQSAAFETPEAFAQAFFLRWQEQWQELLQQQGMPHTPEALGLPPGYIPLQQMGPLGLMAPMGAVAMANLRLLQELQDRVTFLENGMQKTPVKKKAKAAVKKPPVKKKPAAKKHKR